MPKLYFSITINASKEKVWNTMLRDATYRQWTEVFAPGSYFEGSWDQGATIKFLAPDDKEGMGGMVSRIKENRPYEYISIEHLGVIHDGKEDTSSEAVKSWAGALENYTLKEINGVTEVLIDIDINDEYKEMFVDMWPKALQKLKEITESKTPITVTVETTIHASMEKVWECWTGSNHIMGWAYASDDWEAPHAENDVRVGGRFKTVMAAKDKSISFEFTGTYTNVIKFEIIEYDLDDGRHVKVQFLKLPEGIKLIETFEIENIHSKDLQQDGWQAILNNFKKYVEGNV